MAKQRTSLNQMLEEAKSQVNRISVDDAVPLTSSEDHIWIDIRDVREIWRDGTIPCSKHAPRGLLEWRVDPESPYHDDVFSQDKHYILF